MHIGANFLVEKGRVRFWSTQTGDELVIQDHELRTRSAPGAYVLHPRYGNPFVDTLVAEITGAERVMLLPANLSECALQDPRVIGCVVDSDSVVVKTDGRMFFQYQIFLQDGTALKLAVDPDQHYSYSLGDDTEDDAGDGYGIGYGASYAD